MTFVERWARRGRADVSARILLELAAGGHGTETEMIVQPTRRRIAPKPAHDPVLHHQNIETKLARLKVRTPDRHAPHDRRAEVLLSTGASGSPPSDGAPAPSIMEDTQMTKIWTLHLRQIFPQQEGASA